MINTSAICTDEQRRAKVRGANLNGLDYLEVDSDDQLTLNVYFLGKAPATIDENNVIIEGGRRITNIKVLDADVKRNPDPEKDDHMIVTVDKAGDFSTYTLRVVEVDHYQNGIPVYRDMTGFDKRYARLDFSFKAGCASDLDCKTDDVCPPTPLVEPEINYLAKDYASFRQVILDRLALTLPGWQERHVPDIGITLVEILAYVGDYLSYYQDAVATEAYLETARQRISVRRHVRLVDYQMHEGCNARTCLFMETTGGDATLPQDAYFITGQTLGFSSTMLTKENLQGIPSSDYEVFEPLLTDPQQAIQLYEAHNEIHFYIWDEHECCLPRGATSATLDDSVPVSEPGPSEQTPEQQEQRESSKGSPDSASQSSNPKRKTMQHQEPPKDTSYSTGQATERERKQHLKVGDVLIFEEVLGPKTGNPADADPAHRHVVRLTRVESA